MVKQSGPGSNGDKVILHISWSSKTEASKKKKKKKKKEKEKKRMTWKVFGRLA